MGTHDFKSQYRQILHELWHHGVKVPMNTWQSQAVNDRPGMSYSRELQNRTFKLSELPDGVEELQRLIEPNLPWAEDHFLERVSGRPLNPPPSEAWWPFRVKGNAEHKVDEQFSHTYPERIWPKFANEGSTRPNGRQVFVPHNGIRYEYGDLMDVVNLLHRDILTRQAYLPIWFPEDTGAAEGQRVPCTLGYHFMFRPSFFPGEYIGQVVYYIRSCDLLRHFTDDVYMACRLLQQVVGMLRERGINAHGRLLVMHISSLHTFEGDDYRIQQTLGVGPKREEDDDDEIYGAAV
jgi:hypothetical protein